MSDQQLVNIAKAYIDVLRFSVSNPDLPIDHKMKQMLATNEHCYGIVVGFVRGWRMCEEAMAARQPLQPGSN